jgi:electron transfer flavoprotein beta subunit
MNIIVIAGLVPDLVEELEIDGSGTALDTTWLRTIINEFDEHAIEQAILLKERDGSHVTVVAIDQEGIDEVLFTAAAKGADQLIKLLGDFENVNSHALARTFAEVIKGLAPDLILTGVQAHTNIDGSVASLLASILDMPYVG